MAAVESNLPPSIPYTIADATDDPHASNAAVKSIQEPDLADSQMSVTDTNATSLPEVTKLALDNSASIPPDASHGSMKLVDAIENSAHQDTEDTSASRETEMATVSPNDVAAHEISESTTTLVRGATEDSPMENNVKAEDIHASLTDKAPTGLSSSGVSTTATEITADAVPVSETMKASGDESVSGSEEIKGDPSPPNNVVEEPVMGQDLIKIVSDKPNEEFAKEEAKSIAETMSAEQDDEAEKHSIIEDTKAKIDEGEAPGAEIAAVVENKILGGEMTMPTDTTPVGHIPLEEEAKDHSAVEDGLGFDKREAKIEVDQADASGDEVEVTAAGSTADEIHEEAMKVELEEAGERKDEPMEPAIGGQTEESEPTESPVEATDASPLVNETPIATVPAAAENPDIRTSSVETSADLQEALSAPGLSTEEKTSEETIAPRTEAGIIDPPQAVVEELAPLVQEEVLEATTTTANEASLIEEQEVTTFNVEESIVEVEHPVDGTTVPFVAEPHPAAGIEADAPVEEPAVFEREENIAKINNIGTESVVEEVGDITPASTQHEAAAQESSTEMTRKPVIDDAIQQTPEDQPSVEEIAPPAEAEVGKQSVVETAAGSVSEAPVAEEFPGGETPILSETTTEPVGEKVEEAYIVEETTDAQKTDVEHEIIADVISSKEFVEEPPVADHQPFVEFTKIQGGEEQSEKTAEVIEEQASAAVEVSQDEKDLAAVETHIGGVEKTVAEETSEESDQAAAKEIPAEVEMALVNEIPAEAEKVLLEETSVEMEKAVVEEFPTEVERSVVEEVPAETEKSVAELPAEVEKDLVDEAPVQVKADASENELSKPVIEEERLAETPTTVEGEQSQLSEAAVDVNDEVVEKVTEAVSEETIVDCAPVNKGAAEKLHEPINFPAGEKDVVEASDMPVDEKEEVGVKQDVEQIVEPKQVQYQSMGEGEDIALETPEISASVEAAPFVETEQVAEEASEALITENLAVNTLAVETPMERDTIGAPVVEGKHDHDLEELKEVTKEESATQQFEAVVSHEIGDTGTVTLEDAAKGQSEVVPSMHNREVSEADTTTETIIVPDPVTQKKSDSVAPAIEDLGISYIDDASILVHDDIQKDRLQLDVLGEANQVELPKSPWTPSFQVTTIGQGVSLPSEEDIPIHSLDGSEGTTVISSEEAPVAINDSSNDTPTDVSQDEGEEDELKSASSLWTPSYAVHSQGSPNPPHIPLEPEIPATADKEVEIEATVPTFEQTLVHENAVTEKPEPEHVESQPTEAEAEKVAFENVTEEPIAVPANAIAESPDVKEPSSEVLVKEALVSVPAVLEQDASAIPRVGEELPTEDQPLLETAPAELPLSEQHTAKDSPSLTPPEQQSRSASPSWVPSYSVSTQGSPLPRPVPLPSADISEIRLASQQIDALVQEDIQDDAPKYEASSVAAPTVVIDGAQAVEVEKAQPVEDRPATPWTPSYSVTVQGADVLDEIAIESLLPPAQPEKAKEPEVRRRSLSEEMESGAFSPTALIGAGVAGGAAVYAASAALRNSNDGKTSTDIVEPEMHQEKLFPTVQIPDGNKHNTAPCLDGNDGSNTTVARSPETSPISSRKRLESTTSSRLFPGGWFSNSSKIPDERTSLEVAKGVFTGAKQGGSVEGTLQSPTSPTAEPITPIREQSSSDKRKWCTIM